MEPVRIGTSLPPLPEAEPAAAPPVQPEGPLTAPSKPATGSEAKLFQSDVADDVLVAFEHGDPRTPLVTGGLWNSEAPPTEASTSPSNRGDHFPEERAKLLEHQLKNLK